MITLSAILWMIALILVIVLIVRTATRVIRYKKAVEKPEKLLSFQEERLLLCGTVVILLMARYLFAYVTIFKANPNPEINGALLKQYLWTMLIALVWPVHSLALIGSIVTFAVNRAWKRKTSSARSVMRFQKTGFVETCATFFILVIATSILYRSGLFSMGNAYTFIDKV